MTRSERAGTTVEMTERCFRPNVLHVEPGTTVTFVNADAEEHVISGVGIRDGWPTLGAGQSVEMRFDEPGTQTYMCHIHPGMTGAVVVGAEPTLASAETPIDAGGDTNDDAMALWVGLVALAVGLLGGVMLGRRRVTSAA